MTRWMLGVTVTAIAVANLVGCSREGAAPNADDPDFQAAWSSATSRTEPLTIGGNAELTGSANGASEALSSAGDAASEEQLSYAEITRHVRVSMSSLETCYQRVSRSSPGLSGRAVLSFEVESSGQVDNISVNAPRFRGTSLPDCLESRARSWQFRAFAGEPVAASYPLIFVGRR